MEIKCVEELYKLYCDRYCSRIFIGGVKQLFDFIIFKQMVTASLLPILSNLPFHSVIGGILKCNNLEFWI